MKPKLLVLMLWAGALLAQAPRGTFNWWDSPLASDIDLTGDQRLQVRNVIREYRPHLLESRAAVERAELELEEIFNADQIDQRRANDAIERLALARADVTRYASQMTVKLRSVLTPLQWQELQKRRPLGPKQPKRQKATPPSPSAAPSGH